MADETSPPSPDRAFWLLSDESRIEILRAVWAQSGETISFSDLRERVGNPDSGKFNYHLGKLAGHYLAKREEGYRLTQAGREVVRAVLAGTLTETPKLAPSPVDASCPDCGGPLVVSYDEYAHIECGDCGETVMWNEFPPAGLAARTPDEFARAFDRWTQRRFHLAMDGVCPNCACSMALDRPNEAEDDHEVPATVHRCPNCKYEARVPLFGYVFRHPAVIAVYHELGVDVTRLPFWDLRELAADVTVTVTNTDPWAASATVETEAGSLELTLDESLSVTVDERKDG